MEMISKEEILDAIKSGKIKMLYMPPYTEIENKIEELRREEETRNTLNAMYKICYPNNKGGK